jgi:hypothetical protein
MSRDATAGLVIETLPGGTLAFFGAVGLAGGCGGEIICEGLSLIVIPFGLLAVNLGYSAVAICADTNGASCKGYASCPGYTRALET